jgi:integrase
VTWNQRSSATSRPAKIAGITRRFHCHDQRHTIASTLARKGINSFRAISSVTSTRTTERYERPSTEALEAVRLAFA